ncbi:Predicted Zn-dependent peptidase [Pelagirhabdus alkalitolerans]|uniref:Predicted Zn-dependent peptidase n=1 Tax=Pelagirhabdus alkalitolerans TaxID=1612202 RepID=A0A1G6H526_9BACI|nr:pitrilysin family protein [Pelagirhabdus alkalitolerans]SDB89208.1 Predicted Zn-dependent peptidase [Pelagirhabdus alkalitolerans]
MFDLNEKVIEKQGYTLHIIDSKKFKTVQIVGKFASPLNRENITMRALLPFVIQQGNNKYPTAHEFRKALDDLYGAKFSIDGSKKGETHILTARMNVPNPTYLKTDEPIVENAIEFFKEALYNPKADKNGFDPAIVSREKDTLKQKIDSIIDNKMHYANIRMIDEMCQDEPYSLHVHGYPEDFEWIDGKTLFDYYQSIEKNDTFDLYVLGDFSSIDIEAIVGDRFSRDTNQSVQTSEHIEAVKNPEVKEVIETQDVQQGKLHLGFRTHTHLNDHDYPALQVFNAIFGGFPSSKLFINVREKNSLAYYAASRFESHKGLLFVFSGIAPSDYDQAKSIILEQLESMRQADFTEQDVTEAKQMIINQFKETLDDPYGPIEVLYNQKIGGMERTVDQFIESIQSVDRQAIQEIAKKIELNITYFLTSEGGQNDE